VKNCSSIPEERASPPPASSWSESVVDEAELGRI
jgi:hypothetical protein